MTSIRSRRARIAATLTAGIACLSAAVVSLMPAAHADPSAGNVDIAVTVEFDDTALFQEIVEHGTKIGMSHLLDGNVVSNVGTSVASTPTFTYTFDLEPGREFAFDHFTFRGGLPAGVWMEPELETSGTVVAEQGTTYSVKAKLHKGHDVTVQSTFVGAYADQIGDSATSVGKFGINIGADIEGMAVFPGQPGWFSSWGHLYSANDTFNISNGDKIRALGYFGHPGNTVNGIDFYPGGGYRVHTLEWTDGNVRFPIDLADLNASETWAFTADLERDAKTMPLTLDMDDATREALGDAMLELRFSVVPNQDVYEPEETADYTSSKWVNEHGLVYGGVNQDQWTGFRNGDVITFTGFRFPDSDTHDWSSSLDMARAGVTRTFDLEGADPVTLQVKATPKASLPNPGNPTATPTPSPSPSPTASPSETARQTSEPSQTTPADGAAEAQQPGAAPIARTGAQVAGIGCAALALIGSGLLLTASARRKA